jgi:hypothetical protein
MIIGCDTNTVPSIFEVKISKAELGGKFYSESPRLLIAITNNPIIIPVKRSIVIPPGGKSLPIYFDLRNNLPYEYLAIEL